MKRANSIIEIFKKQVKESPNNVGLVTDFSNYSYDEIDKNSDKIADELLRNNVVKAILFLLLCVDQKKCYLRF